MFISTSGQIVDSARTFPAPLFQTFNPLAGVFASSVGSTLECMHFYNILFANIDLKESLNFSTIIFGIEVLMLYSVKVCAKVLSTAFLLFFSTTISSGLMFPQVILIIM